MTIAEQEYLQQIYPGILDGYTPMHTITLAKIIDFKVYTLIINRRNERK
jgi:hypothetical protein